jgi:nucleoside-diphosphate-sugar epimerase
MIHVVKKGCFVFPGNKKLRKSYAYIEGLLDSFEFMMARRESQLTCNYVEQETESLGTLVQIVQKQLGKKIPTFTAPLPLLQLAAGVVQVLTAGLKQLIMELVPEYTPFAPPPATARESGLIAAAIKPPEGAA